MSTLKTILIPTDFSENARHALTLAVENFASPETTFILLHSYKLRHYGAIISTDLDNILKEDSERDMKNEVEWVKATFPGIELVSYLYQGMIVEVISAFVKKNPVDLVVMGTQGVTNAIGGLLGSNASNAIKYVQVPLIIVPASAKIEAFKKVLFATDAQAIDSTESITPLKKVLQSSDATLDILHVMESLDSTRILEREELKINQVFNDVDHAFHFSEQGDVEEEILKFAKENDIDLITLLARNYGFLEGIFHKSMTRKLSLHAKTPLFILHESAD